MAKRELYLECLREASRNILTGRRELPGEPSLDRLATGVRWYIDCATQHRTGNGENRAARDQGCLGHTRREVDELIARHGWRAKGDSPAGQTLTALIVTLRELGHDDLLSLLDEYAKACEQIAEVELDSLGRGAKVEERMVIGTVLGEAALAAIRRLAHQEASARRFEN